VDGDQLRIGRFTVIREIGRGAFATVYLARDEPFDRHVAIKLLTTVRDSTDVHRFREEARHLGQFNDPHIVSVFDFGEHAGAPFIVMEYMAGGTVLPLVGCGDQNRARAVLDDTLCGLSTIHATGRVHRDLKPQNLLLAEDGITVKIADLGLARLLRAAHLTQTGIAPGSPRYMAPEQAQLGREVDARADLYAAGAIAQELLLGTVPLEDPDVTIMLGARIRADPPPVGGTGGWIEPALAEWVDWLIRRRPEDRPHSAEQALAHLRARVSTPPAAPGLGRAARRPLAIVLGVVVAAVAVVTGELWLLAMAVVGYACLAAIPLLRRHD
jgi:serine/threonine protein kinase